MKKLLISLIVGGLLLGGYLTHRIIDLSPYAELIHLFVMWIGALVVSVMSISVLMRDTLLAQRDKALREALASCYEALEQYRTQNTEAVDATQHCEPRAEGQ